MTRVDAAAEVPAGLLQLHAALLEPSERSALKELLRAGVPLNRTLNLYPVNFNQSVVRLGKNLCDPTALTRAQQAAQVGRSELALLEDYLTICEPALGKRWVVDRRDFNVSYAASAFYAAARHLLARSAMPEIKGGLAELLERLHDAHWLLSNWAQVSAALASVGANSNGVAQMRAVFQESVATFESSELAAALLALQRPSKTYPC